jgi:endonuclease YncB( thermonuclease family)
VMQAHGSSIRAPARIHAEPGGEHGPQTAGIRAAPSPFPGGEFRAVCRHVVDGDTFDALVDLGFNQYGYATIRLRGVDTPETRTSDAAEKQRGFAARDRTRSRLLLPPAAPRNAINRLVYNRSDSYPGAEP